MTDERTVMILPDINREKSGEEEQPQWRDVLRTPCYDLPQACAGKGRTAVRPPMWNSP